MARKLDDKERMAHEYEVQYRSPSAATRDAFRRGWYAARLHPTALESDLALLRASLDGAKRDIEVLLGVLEAAEAYCSLGVPMGTETELERAIDRYRAVHPREEPKC